jgi:hypothetical protein
MRKTISIVVATVLIAAALGAWAATRPANSSTMDAQSQTSAIDTLDLMKNANDLPMQQADNLF